MPLNNSVSPLISSRSVKYESAILEDGKATFPHITDSESPD